MLRQALLFSASAAKPIISGHKIKSDRTLSKAGEALLPKPLWRG